MSRGSSSTGPQSWPRYGFMPLTRCPACPREEPLIRLTCKKVETGNYGREFVKCESRPQARKILRQCTYFMWLDAYVEKMQLEGLMDGVNLMEGEESKRQPSLKRAMAAMVEESSIELLAGELKKLNCVLKEVAEWKKIEVAIAAVFYACVLFGVFFFVFRRN